MPVTARSPRARDLPALAFAREGWISGARRPRIGVTWMAPPARYFEFNPEKPRAAEQLGAQLNAIARMAVGGATALTDQRNHK